MNDIDPRIVWITGVTSGIGWALVERFVKEGDVVYATARQKKKLVALRKELAGERGECIVQRCDVRNEREVQSVARLILKRFKKLDILINNAGVTYFKEFAATTIKEFDNILETNLRGLYLTTHKVLPSMLERKEGMVVNILSYATKSRYTKSSAYSASKAGAEALMNSLREEVRDQGIKIVNVFPGATLTPMWHPGHQQKYGHQMMSPDEVAEAIYEVTRKPKSLMIEDIVIRPQIGDLRV